MVGTALAAVDAVQTPSLKTVLARIAASEARHMPVLTTLAQSRAIGISFPDLVDEATATAFLDTHLG